MKIKFILTVFLAIFASSTYCSQDLFFEINRALSEKLDNQRLKNCDTLEKKDSNDYEHDSNNNWKWIRTRWYTLYTRHKLYYLGHIRLKELHGNSGEVSLKSAIQSPGHARADYYYNLEDVYDQTLETGRDPVSDSVDKLVESVKSSLEQCEINDPKLSDRVNNIIEREAWVLCQYYMKEIHSAEDSCRKRYDFVKDGRWDKWDEKFEDKTFAQIFLRKLSRHRITLDGSKGDSGDNENEFRKILYNETLEEPLSEEKLISHVHDLFASIGFKTPEQAEKNYVQ